MGQYYSAVVLKPDYKNEEQPIEMAIKPHDFGNGAKLMEHSYVGNNFVAQACRLLGGKYYGYPFVWCGDYADGLITNKTTTMSVYRYKGSDETSLGIKLKEMVGDNAFEEMQGESIEIPYSEELFRELDDSGKFSVHAGIQIHDAAYRLIGENKFPRKPTRGKSVFKYILNLDTNEFVKIPRFSEEHMKFHPLPLLCSAGNGMGGGDYHEGYSTKGTENLEEYVGIWAYNHIGLSDKVPDGFKELKVNFGEHKYTM